MPLPSPMGARAFILAAPPDADCVSWIPVTALCLHRRLRLVAGLVFTFACGYRPAIPPLAVP